MGEHFLGYFFGLQGNGDQGPVLTLSDGREVKRLEAEHTRRYPSIFGSFSLPRCVLYGSREGQRIECAPLDNRLPLPESSFSYRLQSWAEHLCLEISYQQVSALLDKLLGVTVPVSALERMNGAMGQAVEPYWETTPGRVGQRGRASSLWSPPMGKGFRSVSPVVAHRLRPMRVSVGRNLIAKRWPLSARFMAAPPIHVRPNRSCNRCLARQPRPPPMMMPPTRAQSRLPKRCGLASPISMPKASRSTPVTSSSPGWANNANNAILNSSNQSS